MSSGVVGLVAFAMEMAKVASQVKKAVEQFKSAPKELSELLEKLVLLETVCKLVEFTVATRPELPGGSPPPSQGAISTALLQCQSKMEGLKATLSATGLNSSQASAPMSKTEALSRLRFVIRRDKVKLMVQEVDQIISLLQFVINVETW